MAGPKLVSHYPRSKGRLTQALYDSTFSARVQHMNHNIYQCFGFRHKNNKINKNLWGSKGKRNGSTKQFRKDGEKYKGIKFYEELEQEDLQHEKEVWIL